MEEYLEILKIILTPKELSDLRNQLLLDINNRFQRIRIDKATKILEYNMAVILIIGIEKAKDENINILKILDWYNICPLSCLINSDYKKFIEKYKYYIEKVKKETEKQIKK